jgi:hypothetical protein
MSSDEDLFGKPVDQDVTVWFCDDLDDTLQFEWVKAWHTGRVGQPRLLRSLPPERAAGQPGEWVQHVIDSAGDGTYVDDWKIVEPLYTYLAERYGEYVKSIQKP